MKLNWANRISILRIFLIVPFISLMLKTNDINLTETMRSTARYVSFAIFLVMAFSDALDGYLARRKKQVTTLGVFLDPIADKLLITSACLLLASKRAGVEGFMLPSTVVVLIIGKDLFLLIGFVIVYLITGQTRIATALVGKAATTLQLSMVAAILIAPEFSRLMPWWIWVLRVLWWSAAGAAVVTTFVYFRTGRRYIDEYEQNTQPTINNRRL